MTAATGDTNSNSPNLVLHDALVRFGELLNEWYGQFTDESPAQMILHGKRLVLDDSGKEPPDVILYRRLLLANGVTLGAASNE